MTSPQPQIAAGTPQSRVDGRLKVTGAAKYAADHPTDGVVYAAVVDSSTGRGRITGIDTDDALAQTRRATGDQPSRRTSVGLPGQLGVE